MGRTLEYLSKEGNWSAFWAANNKLLSGQGSYGGGADDPIAAREWFKTLQASGEAP